MKRIWYVIICIILIAFAASIFFYSRLPATMASHWDMQGNVNGYMSRFWGAFLMPIILIGMALLFAAIPLIDPLKANIKKFRHYFDGFIVMIFLFMLMMHGVVIAANLGAQISFNSIMPIAIGILFFYVGIMLEHAKRNWFIGIRTPWTLSSDVVWDRTHSLGAKLFKASGIIAVIGIFFHSAALWFVLAPAIATAVVTMVYSYVVFRRLKK
ncbi:DUF1648 domain-containing protein [Candidatus Woesearchaeota archaeon]|nr:DUF1648 domain-containing protein [Candidatus Woesearchaeota archaeon]